MAQRPDDPTDAPEGLAGDDPKAVSPAPLNDYPQPSSNDVQIDPPVDPDQTIAGIIARLSARSESKAQPSSSNGHSSPFARSRIYV